MSSNLLSITNNSSGRVSNTIPKPTSLAIDSTTRWLKRGIWAYFFLVIFEGALRKWFVPALATPLLIVRDPIALWLIVVAWNRRLLPSTPYLIGMTLIAVIGIFTATLLGHGNLLVALFGARPMLLHFPLIFVMGCLFTREDVIAMGQATLWISLPMVVLIAFQFYSPQSAWVNQGVGGDTSGAGFSGAMGYFRPPGTFSFTNGTSSFFSFVAPFVFYFWLNKKLINKFLLIAATVALLFSIPLSISRGLFFQVAISFLFVLVASARKPEYLGRMVLGVIGGFLVLTLLSGTETFGTAMAAFTDRFENANESEGGLVEGVFLDRYLGGFLGSLLGSASVPFFGFGLGMGTNVGAMLLTGSRTFLIAEGEWGRIIGELGPIMGLSVVFIRVALTAKIFMACYRKLAQADLLPWMLLSYGLITLSQGGWGQPTSLGFFTLIGGLILASLRRPGILSNKVNHISTHASQLHNN
ncbi:hypothetical protein [Hymenobacter polaris]|uniref:hypothetical protein n=1 Tax=Hymenobacter polaris TaxID=2682546 RepID=UPI0018A31C5B|nr:hypothetical protein [Hymenobacter polaris]